MKDVAEFIAEEIMNAIERERRINKDDLITAVNVAKMKYEKAEMESAPIIQVNPVVPEQPIVPSQIAAWDGFVWHLLGSY